jgi:hypothetical protein
VSKYLIIPWTERSSELTHVRGIFHHFFSRASTYLLFSIGIYEKKTQRRKTKRERERKGR